jgi:hypothetical protein
MTVPPDVEAALKVLSSGKLTFGDPLQIQAVQALDRYDRPFCMDCRGSGALEVIASIKAEGAVLREPPELIECQRCGGSGQVWQRRR